MRRTTAAVFALVAVLAAGCTIGKDQTGAQVGEGSIKKIDALSGAQIRVSSKEFDEQLLLGQIALVALQAAGASPQDKTNITGSSNVRQALTSGAVDLYWEYTGTAWISYLHETKPIADPQAQYDAVKQADAANGVTWWARSPANDTYAIAGNPATVAKTGVKTVSDYAALVAKDPAGASTCMGPEFKSRDDGFPGLAKTYGFSLPDPQVHLLNDAVVYTSIGKGDPCGFGSVASTDGRVAGQKLVVLEDDKHFFPTYNPAIAIASGLAGKYPQLEQLFTPIAAKLDTATLTDLNKKVSVDGRKPATVAHDWLKSAGFIS
ncbi:glycine/betaine ABC transporter substrate-binding protein [Amycolatopsis sp. NBRC 101858]|uniref:glycine betaine ABC transporter substrate-binding protein n=1 Tax=Amycolatopsis sp. NBRC 101858 TaxID=3032200 RepID=UPI0024A28E59|nr:glycine betaine ABC transporter substrate-binding protein [Amycolatopsis sp. NBRC 101858]GLY37738.1 glycine/betaine ABC transporter substrate-binding protein [Amycolatopsis sp. NBRC 101858]